MSDYEYPPVTVAQRAWNWMRGLLIGGLVLGVIGGILIGTGWHEETSDNFDLYNPGAATTTTAHHSLAAFDWGIGISSIAGVMIQIFVIAWAVNLGIRSTKSHDT